MLSRFFRRLLQQKKKAKIPIAITAVAAPAVATPAICGLVSTGFDASVVDVAGIAPIDEDDEVDANAAVDTKEM